MNLIRPAQRVIDAADDGGHRIGRIQRLVRIHLPGQICIAGYLPPRQIHRVQPGLDLLHRLIAGQRSQGVDEGLFVQIAPQLFRRQPCERVLDRNRASEPDHVLGFVTTHDTAPSRAITPVALQFFGGRQRSSQAHG